MSGANVGGADRYSIAASGGTATPKNTIRGEECLSTAVNTVHAVHRDHVLTHVALLKPALQACWRFWGVVTRCLRTWLC